MKWLLAVALLATSSCARAEPGKAADGTKSSECDPGPYSASSNFKSLPKDATNFQRERAAYHDLHQCLRNNAFQLAKSDEPAAFVTDGVLAACRLERLEWTIKSGPSTGKTWEQVTHFERQEQDELRWSATLAVLNARVCAKHGKAAVSYSNDVLSKAESE